MQGLITEAVLASVRSQTEWLSYNRYLQDLDMWLCLAGENPTTAGCQETDGERFTRADMLFRPRWNGKVVDENAELTPTFRRAFHCGWLHASGFCRAIAGPVQQSLIDEARLHHGHAGTDVD
jgi:hypothetical protein